MFFEVFSRFDNYLKTQSVCLHIYVCKTSSSKSNTQENSLNSSNKKRSRIIETNWIENDAKSDHLKTSILDSNVEEVCQILSKDPK